MNLKSLFCRNTESSETDAPQSATNVQNVTPEAAHSLLKGQSVTVLDIRTAKEYSDGHIPGAVNIDFHSTDFEVSLQQLDKQNPYIIHCAGGGRSGRSLPVFLELGFKTIYHLDSGYKGWEKANLPVEK